MIDEYLYKSKLAWLLNRMLESKEYRVTIDSMHFLVNANHVEGWLSQGTSAEHPTVIQGRMKMANAIYAGYMTDIYPHSN